MVWKDLYFNVAQNFMEVPTVPGLIQETQNTVLNRFPSNLFINGGFPTSLPSSDSLRSNKDLWINCVFKLSNSLVFCCKILPSYVVLIQERFLTTCCIRRGTREFLGGILCVLLYQHKLCVLVNNGDVVDIQKRFCVIFANKLKKTVGNYVYIQILKN